VENNEAFTRINDSIRGLATDGPADETWEFFCECTDVGCRVLISLSLYEFDARRRASPSIPILAVHHDAQPAGVEQPSS
jgi:hypothetical protein